MHRPKPVYLLFTGLSLLLCFLGGVNIFLIAFVTTVVGVCYSPRHIITFFSIIVVVLIFLSTFLLKDKAANIGEGNLILGDDNIIISDPNSEVIFGGDDASISIRNTPVIIEPTEDGNIIIRPASGIDGSSINAEKASNLSDRKLGIFIATCALLALIRMLSLFDIKNIILSYYNTITMSIRLAVCILFVCSSLGIIHINTLYDEIPSAIATTFAFDAIVSVFQKRLDRIATAPNNNIVVNSAD